MLLASAAPKPSGPKRRRKYLLIGTLTFISLLIGVLLSLPFYSRLFIPWITDECQRQIGRKATIGDLTVNLFSGYAVASDIQIKEKDSTKNFLWLQKVQAKFSLAGLLVRKIFAINCRVSGMKLVIRLDAKGRANYQSILEHLATANPSPSTQPLSRNPPKLPLVKANILLSDLDLHFENAQNSTILDVDGLCFKCNIDDLENIRFNSQWDSAALNTSDFQAKAGYRLQGGACLKMKDGRMRLTSYGQADISPLHLTLASKRILSNDKLHFSWNGEVESDTIFRRMVIKHCRLEHQAISLHFQGSIEESGGEYFFREVKGGCHGDLARLPPVIVERLLNKDMAIDGKFINNFELTGTLDRLTFTNRLSSSCDLELLASVAMGGEPLHPYHTFPQQVIGQLTLQIANKSGLLTVTIQPSSLKISSQQQPILVSELAGCLYDRRFDKCRLTTTVHSQPLRQAIIRIAARWPDLQKQLQQRWQTSGSAELMIDVHGNIDEQITAEVVVNLDRLECEWQDRQQHPLLAKAVAIPLGCQLRITHHLAKRQTIIDAALLTVADLRVPLATVKIIENRLLTVTDYRAFYSILITMIWSACKRFSRC